jgi:transposase-like protein
MAAFKWRRFAGEVISRAVRCYHRCGINCREPEEVLAG